MVFEKRSRVISAIAACLLFSSQIILSGSVQADEEYVTKQQWLADKQKMSREEKKLQKDSLKISRYMEEARKLRNSGRYSSARRVAERALKIDPRSDEANAFLEYLSVAEERAEARKHAREEARKEEKRRAREAKKRKKTSDYKPRVADIKKEKPEAETAPEPQKGSAEKTTDSRPQTTEESKELSVKESKQAESADETAAKVKGAVEKHEDAKTLAKFTGTTDKAIEEQFKSGQPIIVDGDKVEYFEQSGTIGAEGNVSITYGDVKLTCDSIKVSTKDKIALCEGNVRIEHPEKGVMTGDRIKYDLKNKRGEIIGGELDAFPWFAHAAETSKVGDNEYLVTGGSVTTCDLDEPHYRIAAQEIRVFPNDKVIAKNAVAYLGKVPVMWWPYYYHPVIQSRAKVQFIPGYRSDWGYFMLSAWRFYLKGNSRVDVLIDYRTEKGFAGGADLYYDLGDFGLEGLGEGLFRAYFIDQNGWGTYDPRGFRDEGDGEVWRRRYQWKHRIEFDERTTGMFEFNKMSDEHVLKDYFYNEYEENNRIPPNYISIISSNNNYTFSFEANKRFNDFYTVTQRLPELKIVVPDQRLWETPFYYSTEMSATRFEKEYKFAEEPTERTDRFDTWHKLSYVASLGPLNITPYGTFRGTMYTRNRWDESRAIGRVAFGGGVNVFSRFHKVYDVDTDVLGLDINDLRHIIVPRADYFHRHQPTVDKDNLYQMDHIDSIEKENKVRFALENKIQTKRHFGKELKAVDLIRSTVSVDYLFRMEKDSFEMEKNGKFKDLEFEIELRPYNWMYIEGETEINTENQAVKTGSISSEFRPTKDFAMALGYRYEKKAPDTRNQFTFDVNYRINPKWKVGWYERFDIENGEIEEQQLSLVRDLHCWEVEVVYDLLGDNPYEDEFAFWFAFKIKAFPDLPIGLSRSFNRRPPGSLQGP